MEVLACQEQYFHLPILLSYKVIVLTPEPQMVVLKHRLFVQILLCSLPRDKSRVTAVEGSCSKFTFGR